MRTQVGRKQMHGGTGEAVGQVRTCTGGAVGGGQRQAFTEAAVPSPIPCSPKDTDEKAASKPTIGESRTWPLVLPSLEPIKRSDLAEITQAGPFLQRKTTFSTGHKERLLTALGP